MHLVDMDEMERREREAAPTKWAKTKAFARVAIARQPAKTPEEWRVAAREAFDAMSDATTERFKKLAKRHGPGLASASAQPNSIMTVASACANDGRAECLEMVMRGADLSDDSWRGKLPVLLEAVSGGIWKCAKIALEAGGDLAETWPDEGDNVFRHWARAMSDNKKRMFSGSMLEWLVKEVSKLPRETAAPLLMEGLRALNDDIRGSSATPQSTIAETVFRYDLHTAFAQHAPLWALPALAGAEGLNPEVQEALVRRLSELEAESLAEIANAAEGARRGALAAGAGTNGANEAPRGEGGPNGSQAPERRGPARL
jgi:hypothetical protein